MKIEDFHNVGVGKKAVILTCGPSLNNYDEKLITDYCADKIVLVVKQAINKFPELKDTYHFINNSHLPHKKYVYKNRPKLIVTSDNIGSKARQLSKFTSDMFFEVSKMKGVQGSVCGKTPLDNFMLSRSKRRPCGPGIMFETVFFFVQHLGVSSVSTIGWDGYPSKNKKHQHFFPLKEASQCTYVADHNKLAIKGSKHIFNWLKSHRCDLKIVGESHQWEGIPRIKLCRRPIS